MEISGTMKLTIHSLVISLKFNGDIHFVAPPAAFVMVVEVMFDPSLIDRNACKTVSIIHMNDIIPILNPFCSRRMAICGFEFRIPYLLAGNYIN